MKYKKYTNFRDATTLKALSFGIFCGIISCIFLLIIFSTAFVKFEYFPSNIVSILSFATTAIGTFTASYISLKILKRHALVYGSFVGLLLFLFFTIVGFFASRDCFTLFTLIKLFIMIFIGALGGIISANK